MPTEPPVTDWAFPDVSLPPEAGGPDDLVGAGADLEPGTLLAAYRRGLFPMPADPSAGREGTMCVALGSVRARRNIRSSGGGSCCNRQSREVGNVRPTVFVHDQTD